MYNWSLFCLVSTKTPTLICPNDNNGGKLSKFTVNDTINGNGKLNYKIGMLTADEATFAGLLFNKYNYSTYLQENTGKSSWWTMTPFDFSGNYVNVWNIYSGNLNYVPLMNSEHIRPAIALTSETLISGGTGTSEDPYIIK